MQVMPGRDCASLRVLADDAGSTSSARSRVRPQAGAAVEHSWRRTSDIRRRRNARRWSPTPELRRARERCQEKGCDGGWSGCLLGATTAPDIYEMVSFSRSPGTRVLSKP